MRYQSVRPLLKSGDILAFGHEGWSSKSDIESQIVRVFTRSEYSHVGISWVVGGRVFIIEAVVPMVRIYPLSKCLPFYWIEMPHALTIEAEEYALSRIGEPYSKWEAIKGFFNRESDNGAWQCAELVKSVMAVNDIQLPGKATPTDVVRAAIVQGDGNPLLMVQP